jgi:hypothetical protein
MVFNYFNFLAILFELAPTAEVVTVQSFKGGVSSLEGESDTLSLLPLPLAVMLPLLSAGTCDPAHSD